MTEDAGAIMVLPRPWPVSVAPALALSAFWKAPSGCPLAPAMHVRSYQCDMANHEPRVSRRQSALQACARETKHASRSPDRWSLVYSHPPEREQPCRRPRPYCTSSLHRDHKPSPVVIGGQLANCCVTRYIAHIPLTRPRPRPFISPAGPS